MTPFTEANTYYYDGHKLGLEEQEEAVNPKQAYGDKKVPLHLVPSTAMVAIAMGLKEGSKKYGAFNWRTLTVEAETYLGATLRHLMAWQDGEDLDPDSGNTHLSHAMASLAILVDAIEAGNVHDNRPPKGAGAATLTKYAEK
jgi:hypothetical protein